MKVAVSGSSGLVGTALTTALRESGHDVLRLVRRPAQAPDEHTWDPAAMPLDPTVLDGVEAVVNLAGPDPGEHRWTRSYKRTLRDSRVRATTVLASAVAAMDEPPRAFVSASGVSYYGTDHGRDVLDENSPAGTGFLAELCADWEAATAPAHDAGVAVSHARFGVVIGRGGGALARLSPFFRAGLGGSLGNGEQFWSHVSVDDAVRAVQFLVEQHGCVGPYNITAPEPVSNAEFSRVLGWAMHRPVIVSVPELALRVVLGEYSDTIVGSLRVTPSRLLDAGFVHRHPDARSVVLAALND